MIHPDALASLRAAATVNAWKLDGQQRNALAALALSVAYARNATLEAGHERDVLDALYDLAPTVVVELRRLLDLADSLVIPEQTALPFTRAESTA